MIAQMTWCFEHVVKHIEHMLACALAKQSFWTVAAHDVGDLHFVDIGLGASYLHGLAWAIEVVCMAVFFDAALPLKHNHAISVGAVQKLVIGLRRIRHVAMDQSVTVF